MIQVPPLLDRISDYVCYWAQHAPERPAFLAVDGETSYAEFNRRVDALTRALLAGGVRRGDRVAMLATPRPIFLESLLACASCGAVWVGINPRHTASEIADILADAKPRLILCQHSFEQSDLVSPMAAACEMAQSCCPIIVFHGDDPGMRSMSDFLEGGSATSDDDLQYARAVVEAADPAVLVYTSGSTGKPKGVMLSHHSLCFVYREQIQAFGIVGGRFMANLPINHVGGIGFVGCNPLIGGGSMYFMDRFDPNTVLELAESGTVDCLLELSSMIQALVDLPRFKYADLSRVRTIAWGGAALPPDTVSALLSKGCRLATLYGMSEMPGSISVTRPDASIEELTQTVGRVSPYMELRIVGDNGSDTEAGAEGEIRVRHSAMFLGYFAREAETRATLDEDGFFRTGDIGTVDRSGNLRVVGRLKEMYKSGGYNIYPREIEACLERHPSVAGASVVSVADPRFQEVGWAFVQLRLPGVEQPGVEDLLAWCTRHLANYKRPKRIILVNDFPKLANGKVDRVKLKETASRLVADGR